jgi:cytosine/adenosine deaminase-related metal-dependent hydrolase
MTDFLIRNAAAIMTGQPGDAARTEGDAIRVRAGRIEAVGRLQPQPGETVHDASGCVIYPGWVNTHHHLFQSVMKGIPAGIDAPLFNWLEAVPVSYRRYLDADSIRVAATIGMAELLLSGCMTIADHHYAYWPGMGFDSSAILFEVAEALGVRYVLMRGGATKVRAFETDAPPQSRPETLEQILEGVARDVARFHQPQGDAMRRVVMAPTTPTFSVEPHELPIFAREARRLGIRLHTHLSETQDYVRYCAEVHSCTPVEFVERHEWTGEDVFFAHAVHLTEAEMRTMARTGCGMAHCAQSNCRLGSGIAPAPAFARMGGRVSLGVDGAASNEAADMISEAHSAWHVHRAAHGADAVRVEDVINWGTRGGGDVLGLDLVGGIAPGMAADLAVYALDHLRYAGLHDIALAPVICAGQAHLKYGFCNGRLVVEDGRIPGLDLPGLMREARAQVARMRQ